MKYSALVVGDEQCIRLLYHTEITTETHLVSEEKPWEDVSFHISKNLKQRSPMAVVDHDMITDDRGELTPHAERLYKAGIRTLIVFSRTGKPLCIDIWNPMSGIQSHRPLKRLHTAKGEKVPFTLKKDIDLSGWMESYWQSTPFLTWREYWLIVQEELLLGNLHRSYTSFLADFPITRGQPNTALELYRRQPTTHRIMQRHGNDTSLLWEEALAITDYQVFSELMFWYNEWPDIHVSLEDIHFFNDVDVFGVRSPNLSNPTSYIEQHQRYWESIDDGASLRTYWVQQ